MEVTENLSAIRKHLRGCSSTEQPKKESGRRTDLPYEGAGSVREIAEWLNHNGQEVMSIGKKKPKASIVRLWEKKQGWR